MIDVETMNVIMEFPSGIRAQYQILVPDNDSADLQVWFNTHHWVSARAFVYNIEGTLCVDETVCFINLDHVATIREFDK